MLLLYSCSDKIFVSCSVLFYVLGPNYFSCSVLFYALGPIFSVLYSVLCSEVHFLRSGLETKISMILYHISESALSGSVHRTPNSRCSLFDCSGCSDRTVRGSPVKYTVLVAENIRSFGLKYTVPKNHI